MATKTARLTSTDYTGPMPREMIANHTLAKEIINRHDDPCPILDDNSIALLRDFVTDPASAQALLKARGLADGPDDVPGAKVRESGSLVAHIMYNHGGETPALTDDEIRMLQEWFENGGGKP